MFFGPTAFIDAEMFNTLLPMRSVMVSVNTYRRGRFSPGGYCPRRFASGGGETGRSISPVPVGLQRGGRYLLLKLLLPVVTF